MKKSLRKIALLCATAIVTTGVLAGCAGVNKSGAEGSSNSSSRFVYAAQQVVGSIDPAKALDETELISVINMYDPLFYPDRANESMAPAPHIAESYELSEDGKVYTIKLRNDVTFHSGNKLTAKDVVYSIERMLAINEGNSWLWANLFAEGGIKEVDETTVEFNLNKPYAPFISSLTQLFVVDSQLLKENEVDGDYGQKYLEDHDAGSGAYTLGTWNRQADINFEAYPEYWLGWKDNQVKSAQMKFISEEATVKTLLQSGQADIVHQYLNPTAYEEFKKNDKIVVQEDPSAMLQEMPINTQKAPTDDVNVRKAIATIFDYETATKDILKGSAKAKGPVPNMVEGHSDTLTVYERNIEKAKEYLSQSKYAGQDLTVTFQYLGDVASQRQYSQLITANLAEIGINVEVITSTWPQVTEAASNPETTANLTVISDTLKYPHIDSHTYGKYHPSAHGSYRSAAWLNDEEVTKTLDAARAAITVEEQMDLYGKAQDLITELSPSIYISNETHRIAYQKDVQGYQFIPLMGYDIAFYYFSK